MAKPISTGAQTPAAPANPAPAATLHAAEAGLHTPPPPAPVPAAAVGTGAHLPDASGEHTADERTPVAQAVANAVTAVDTSRLSPPLGQPRAMPLPAVQPHGTKGDTKPTTAAYSEAFDRRYTIETLTRHPIAEVRQRAEEAQAALHHGAANAGLLMRAAIDVAKRAESTR